MLSSRTIEPVATKLAKQNPWVKGLRINFCFSNEGPHPHTFPRRYYSDKNFIKILLNPPPFPIQQKVSIYTCI